MSTQIRKIFSVLIRNNEYDVYDIDGKEHAGYGDIPKTWWLYYSEKLPGDLLPPADSEHFLPYHKWIKRKLWEIKIKEYNTSKYKWDEYHFSHGISVEMWCNNKHIYSFRTNDLNFAMGKIQYLEVVLSEHPYNFFEPEKEEGRKIFWYGLPATIKTGFEPGEVHIVPDYTTGFSRVEWWEELARRESNLTAPNKVFVDSEFDMERYEDRMDDNMRSDYINWGDALSDKHIGWFRKD